jgi:predicted transcriptional regulator YheO
MRISHYRYLVQLSEEQRRWLEAMIRTSKTPATHSVVARVLLMSDQSQGQPEATDGQKALAHRLFADPHHSIPEICSPLGISRSTLYRYVRETEPPT